MSSPVLTVPAWAWAVLALVVGVSIALDLVLHRGSHVDSKRRAVVWSLGWISLALVFNLLVAVQFGTEAGEQFLAAYLLEKSLSIDNLFVFLLIFGALKIPLPGQRRVLTWGIAGAVVTRGLLIFVGAAAVHEWHSLLYVFGGILVIAAFKLLREPEPDAENRVLRWLSRRIPITELDGQRFVSRRRGRRVATPLLLAVVAIELTDIVFAIDSVPAAFAVTEEPFLIYSSNLFAILGLRALYIVLAAALARLRYLRFGLAGVLAFAGAKLLLGSVIVIPPLISVGIIAILIAIPVVLSLRVTKAGESLTTSGTS